MKPMKSKKRWVGVDGHLDQWDQWDQYVGQCGSHTLFKFNKFSIPNKLPVRYKGDTWVKYIPTTIRSLISKCWAAWIGASAHGESNWTRHFYSVYSSLYWIWQSEVASRFLSMQIDSLLRGMVAANNLIHRIRFSGRSRIRILRKLATRGGRTRVWINITIVDVSGMHAEKEST